MQLNIKDTFNKELPADPNRSNVTREVLNSCFSFVTPRKPSAPTLLHVSSETASLLGISEEELPSQEFLEVFSGAKVLNNTDPYAMCYAGHQFGNWAGQLGDGRAINLAEVVHHEKRWAMQLKGAGMTPYSRSADGLAVLRSSIREYLCSEAMHALGVPTTRALSLALTGDEVLRDVMYNGNAAYEKGAVVCRVAPSFIRFGNFQILAQRNELDHLKTLTDYTINGFFPNIPSGSSEGYITFFNEVVNSTIDMIIHWQRVGFVHGVMNTDNMSILGQTIDYGPYGWLEGYDADWTPNTTDNSYRRYRFGNQSQVALWNLVKLAEAIYPLVGDTQPFQAILEDFNLRYDPKYQDMMRQKLGLTVPMESDRNLIEQLDKTLQLTETDMTLFFRQLAKVSKSTPIKESITFLDPIMDAFYRPEELLGSVLADWTSWLKSYLDRLNMENISDELRKKEMNLVNPKYVLRNYMAQLAIDEADNGNNALLEELFTLLKKPYDEQINHQKWFSKRPEWARNKVGCSMLSCSS
jgi:uncharacterized protein YdiU (UPF0061 family)